MVEKTRHYFRSIRREGGNTVVSPYEMQMKKLICPRPFLAPNRVANPSERKKYFFLEIPQMKILLYKDI